MAASDRVFPSAHTFRRLLQELLPGHLDNGPTPAPLDGVWLAPVPALPREVAEKWPTADVAKLAADRRRLAAFPIDHRISPVAQRGGFKAARKALAHFLDTKLTGYEEGRNHPDNDATSGLSPYLHWGHISVHEVLAALARRLGWSPEAVAVRHDGMRGTWWGMTPAAEAYLDELVTWRELAFNFAAKREDVERYESLPGWARRTLESHANDPRPHLYSREQLAAARTHDEVWNAAERQLLIEGRIHGYLRMLWGKKILEWSASPQEAVTTMIHLNDALALDGRGPNSYAGVMWCLGRYDRPWAPERPIFGTVRYMSSQATARKLHLKGYLQRFGGEAPSQEA
jgi:deoxyribodipyrimidine photo-lyase